MLLIVMLYVLLQVFISQPPVSSSRSPPSLFSIDILSDVIEEYEEQQNRERIMWRHRAREARDRRLALEAEERVARDKEGEDYPVVRATVGAVGDGSNWRGRREVSYSLFCL